MEEPIRTTPGKTEDGKPFDFYIQEQVDLPPVFVPVFKLELNPILKCFVSTEVVES